MAITTLASTNPRNGGGVAASAPRPLPVKETPIAAHHLPNKAGQLGPSRARTGIVAAALKRGL